MAATLPLRLDAHQHFWRYDAAAYPWIGRDMGRLRRDFQPDDLRPLLDAAGLDGCIAVQARACESETGQLLELAERYPWIRAVVGWVDLCSDDLEQSLERWAQNPVLRGFRHQLQVAGRKLTRRVYAKPGVQSGANHLAAPGAGL